MLPSLNYNLLHIQDTYSHIWQKLTLTWSSFFGDFEKELVELLSGERRGENTSDWWLTSWLAFYLFRFVEFVFDSKAQQENKLPLNLLRMRNCKHVSVRKLTFGVVQNSQPPFQGIVLGLLPAFKVVHSVRSELKWIFFCSPIEIKLRNRSLNAGTMWHC